MQIRDYQEKALQSIIEKYETGTKKVLLQLPTGGGKTVIFAELIKKLKEKKGKEFKSLVLAHKKELVLQAKEKIEAVVKEECGIIKAGIKPNKQANIQVASVQSLQRRAKPPADLIVIDEAHHATAATYQNILKEYPEALILGCTATPIRSDGYGLNDVFEEIVLGPSVEWLIESGYLSQYKVFVSPEQLKVKRLTKKNSKEYSQKELETCLEQNHKINKSVIEQWQEKAVGKQTLIFCISVAHSEKLAKMFQENGIAAAHLDGTYSDIERDVILNKFRNKEIQVLTNCAIVSEGFDVPAIEVIQIVRPTTSLGLWLQILGRGLRPDSQKKFALILDHTDNVSRLGFPDEAHQWSLAPVAANKDYAKQCNNCGHCFKPMPNHPSTKFAYSFVPRHSEKEITVYQTNCPNCEHHLHFVILPTLIGEPQDEIDYNPSKFDPSGLKLLETERQCNQTFLSIIKELEVLRQANKLTSRQLEQQVFEQAGKLGLEKQLTLKDLQTFANILGYKKGWAWYRFNEFQNKQQTQEPQIAKGKPMPKIIRRLNVDVNQYDQIPF